MNLTPRIHLKKLNRHSFSFSKSLFLASLKVYLCSTKIQILFLLFSIGVVGAATAQQYPVDCRISITPPYANRFYDYQNSPQRFKVTLLLQDHTKPTLDVVLQIRLKGPGFIIENPEDFFTAQPITLNPGRPQTLSGLELSDNFSPANLETQGIELADLFTGGGLPPGPYEWEVRAFELYRDRQVSNTASFRMNLALKYPPLLNQPTNNAQLSPTQPQSLNFSWMPRPSASLAARQGLLYTLMLYEVPLGEDPNAVVNSGSAPFRVIETGQTNYFYGPLEVPLEVGKTYAWQVKMSDINGRETYVNNGYSEVSWFRYGKACTAPEDLKATEIGPNRVNLSWQADPQAMGYKVYYKNQTAADWQTQTTFGTSLTLAGLDQKEPYSFKISTLCDVDGESPTSPEITWEAEKINTELQKLIDAVLHPLDQISSGTTPTASPKTDNVNTSGQPSSQAATDPLPTNIANLIPKDPTKIPCVSQVRGFENCSVTHDGVTLMGTEPLQSLAVGDPLTIYDMQAIVTEVSGGGGTYSGKAIVKLPFLADMMMAVEFSNIEVKTEKPATYRGGCVTNVPASGFFRARTGLSREELKAEEVAFLDQILKAQDPGSTYTNLSQQIGQYNQTTKEIADATAAGQSLSTEQKEALLAQTIGLNSQISTWLENATDLIGGTTAGDPILAQIQAILDQLAANQTAMEAGTSFPSVPNIGITITGLIDQIKALLEAPPTDSPAIQNLQATNITDRSASLSWQGDKRFTKYIVTLQKSGEGERIFVVSGEKIEVDFLSEASEYNIKVVGYVENEKIDTEYGSFDTKTIKVPKPENVKLEILDNGKLSVTWDKNDVHKSFVFKYKDKNGFEKIAYPTKNKIEIADFDFNMGYEYSVVAVGESAKRSEANDGNFNFDKNCNRFNTIKISSSNFADSKEVSSGTAVTLSVPDAQASKCLSNIEWFFKGNSLGNGNEQVVRPNEMINEYTVKCSKLNNGSYSPPTSCESKVVIKTIPWCETTTIKTSSTNVSEGEQILLTREKNCEVAQKSYWADAAGNVLSDTNNLLVKPQYGAINTWYLNCVNGEETCRVPSPIISVIKDEDDCKKMQIALPKMDEYHALFQLPGCTNIVKWEVIGSEGETISKLVKKRNSIFRSIPLIKTIVSTFTTRNLLSKYAFPDSYLSQFSDKNTIVVYRQNKTSTKVPVPIEQITVKATCAKTPEYNCVITKTIDNQGSCENFQCSSYIASNDINGGEAVDLRIASSLDNNGFSDITNANLANKSAMFASTMVGNIFSVLGISTNDIIEAEKNQILSWDAYTSCNGYEFKYFWDELGESGINKQIQKKSYPQVFHVTKSYESREAEGEIRACPQKLEVVVPAKKEGQTNSENFGLKTITLENQIEYIFPANCQNEFEDGFLLLESPTGYSFVKNSEVVPIKVLPKPWYLKASCILSGNVYTDTYKGEKSGAEQSLEIMYWAAFIGKLYVNNFVEDDGLFTSDIIAAFTKCFPESSTVNSDNGKVKSANLQNLKIEGKIEEQTIKNTEMALSTTGDRCYDMKNLKIGTQIATNLGLVLKQLIEATKFYDKATFSFDPSTFNQSDLEENASLTTFFPLNNDFIEYTKKYGTTTKSANENYLSVNVTKKVLENLCQKTQQMGLQNQSKEMLCKLRSAFKNIGVDLPDPVKDPQTMQDFKEGNCASMVAYWGGEKTAISSANARAILAQNDAIIASAGDGECRDESNNTLTVTATPKQPTCKNNDGEISVSATGGSGSYEYKLSTSTTYQVTNLFKNLKPGTYTIDVKDKDGNKGQTKLNLIGALCLSSVTPKNTTCGNTNGSIVVLTSGGQSPITYTLNGGAAPIINNTGNFTGLKDGTYTISIEDSGTPKQTLTTPSQTIAPSTPLTFTISNPVDPTCYDGKNGKIDFEIRGGQTPYLLSASSFSNTLTLNTTPYISKGWSAFKAGTHQLTVNDNSGCPAVTSSFTLQNVAKIDITSTTQGASCGKSDGEVSITANNGLAPYTFRTDNTTYNTTNPISNLAAGNYNIFAKDANGCEANEPTKITTAGTLQFKPTSIEDGTYNGEYGWDDGSQYSQSQFLIVVAQNPTDYEKIDTKGCKEYFAPWLSLLPGNNGAVNMNLLLDTDLQTYLQSGKKVTLNATTGISLAGGTTYEINSSNVASSIMVEIKSSINTTPSTLGLDKNIVAKDADGKVIGKLNIISGKPQVKELNVYFVKHNANPVRTDLTLANMEDALNKQSHNQGLVNYKLKVGTLAGTNGVLDISKVFNVTTDTDYGPILKKITTTYKELLDSKKNIFISDISIVNGTSYTGGITGHKENVLMLNRGDKSDLIHEVGHLYDLYHTFCACSIKYPKQNTVECRTQLNGRCLLQGTTSNFMDYDKPEKTHFDFFQWKIIFNTAKTF